MELVNLVINVRPSKLEEYHNRFEIFHNTGEHSTIFKPRRMRTYNDLALESIYSLCDGADLFSSTFKISSLIDNKEVDGVVLVENLLSARKNAESILAKFPEESYVFMSQSGIGVYAIGKETLKIYEWDEVLCELTEQYDSIGQVFAEWANAVG